MAVRAESRTAAAGAQSPRRAGTIAARWRLAATGGLLAAGAALFVFPLGMPPGSRIDLERMNGYGLVSVLPLASLAGIAVTTVAFLLTLASRRPHPMLLGAELVVLVGCLHGVAALVEPLPRFATAWQHVGFVEYIARTGETLPGWDARFNWPGFFALAAFLAAFLPGGADVDGLSPVLRLAPVAFHLLYLVGFLAIVHRLRATWRARWFAAWLLVGANWVGQDYFSPQAEGYLIYLLFLAILLTWYRPYAQPETRSGAAPLVLLLALFGVLTASHQLTPFLLLAACTGLVLARRCVLAGLPLLLVVIVAGWISFLAMPYWSGHLATIVGDIGRLGGNVSAGTTGGVGGGRPQPGVQYARFLVAATVFALAAVGTLRRRRSGYRDRVAVVLVAAPFSAFALQSYGGEIALRVYLFALPAAGLLAAFALFPAPGIPSRRTLAAAALCALVVTGGFLVARYGNEPYEQVRPGEVAAMDHVYRHDAGGARVLWLTPAPEVDLTPNMPWGFRDMEKVEYVSARAPRDPSDVTGLVRTLRELGPRAYLVTTRGQEAYFGLVHDFPPDWGDRFRRHLAAADGVAVAAANADAAVYAADPPPDPAAAAPPDTGPTGARLGSTPLTPVGLAALPLLLAVLFACQRRRLRHPPGEPRRDRRLRIAAAALLAVFLAAVVERLVLLA